MITEEKISEILCKKISILQNGIIDRMPILPLAIYLVGGYGRGEGAWYEDKEGIHPYNDFDIAVITDNPLSHDETEALRKELACKVGITWVDIDYYSLGALSTMKPTIHNVDLLEGGLLIYGEDVVKKNGFKLDSKKIGRQDLITLYWTRMWTFLGSWEGEFRDLDVLESRMFKNQMAKAVLAACDMRLVKMKQYTTSYRERVKRVTNTFSYEKRLCELSNWAIKEKTRPSSNSVSKSEMESLYFCIKEEFLKAFEFSFGKDFNYFLNPYKTKEYYILHTKSYLYHLYALLRCHKSKIARRLDVFYAMNYIFHANNAGSIQNEMLQKATKLLVKNNYIQQSYYTWDELRIQVANARNNI